MTPRLPSLVSALLAALSLALVTGPAFAQDPAPAAAEPPPVTEPVPAAPAVAPVDAPRALTQPPVGRAAAPTEAATRGEGRVRAGLEVFASYIYQNLQNQDGTTSWYHVFDLPRAHAALEGEIEHVRGRVLVEAVRSASEGALLGVAGDSLVLRVREAYAAYRPLDIVEASAGVLPTATIPELDGTWMMRAVAPSALESSGLAAPADLGARVRLDLPREYGFVSTSAYNGEGYTSRELNRGKNVEIASEIHPAPEGPLLPLGLFGSYVAGSAGTSQARADRVTGGAVWQGERVRAGAFGTYAWGVRDAAQQHAVVMTAFTRVEPAPRLLLGARFDHVVRDTKSIPDDRVSTLLLSVGWRFADSLETFLTFARSIPTTKAEAEVPGTNDWQLRATARVVF